MKPQPVIRISPTALAADGDAAKVYQTWREKGLGVRDLIERAITAYGKTDEYKQQIKEA